MLRCVRCGCSRLDSEAVGCVLCGGSPSLRTEPCHINEDTKAKLLAHAEELKGFGVSLEVHKSLAKVMGAAETLVVVLALADSLHHGVLRELVLFLREKKISSEEILRLRLDEPEKILAYYAAGESGARETRPKHGRGRKSAHIKRTPRSKAKGRKTQAKRHKK